MSRKITLNLGDDLISLVLRNGEKVTLTIVSENDEPSIHSLYKSNVSVDNSANNNVEDTIGYANTSDEDDQLSNNEDDVFNALMVKKSSPELNHENVPAYSPLQLSELDDNDSYDVTEDMQSDVSQKTAVNPSFYDDVSRLSSPSQFELDDEEYVSPIIPNDESEDIEDVFEEKPSSIKEILDREAKLSESESDEDESNTSVETSETDTDVNTEESSDQNDDVLLNEDDDVNVNESDESENDSDDSVANRDELALFGSSNDDENIDEIASDDDSEDDDESNDNYSNGFFFEPVDDDDESDEREF